ncbi:MerR family DNA-binding transcriptional regulator [Phenylobacterium sp. LjRoot164]|uniref:MerR family transcriptional regulator n=1 Tax=unclassified Phenylobacterium TaxID=2640670 RepID=UPI0022B5576C|nr:MerR family DNA-binding transcriptional regulator [Phenylobacterium sp. NIBR 498073]MBS0490702.1 MerR family DNA-binding transcriptional regulator [Pseudomonadota bacterium]WGU41060.1 MerR family DNA-binding transcriptional regulator [Phenylobacterium sp. NIBR 498073]
MLQKLRRPATTFTITQLCREFGTTPRALRYYEEQGLLSPSREGQARIYTYRDRARLTLILRGKHVGLSLAEIRDILDLYERDDDLTAQNTQALGKFKERIKAFEEQRREIDQAIDVLHDASARLEAALAERAGRAAFG